MKKAINLYVLPFNTKEKIKLIKEAGFDSVYTGIYDEKETLKLDEIMSIFEKEGFFIPQMHCLYYEPNLKYLWKEGELGDKQIEDLLRQIDVTAKYHVKNFVFHTCGEFNPPTSMIGIRRIEKLLQRCNQYDINLCVENLYDFKQMKFIFDNINNKNLKVCYDCGHHNCLNPKDDVFGYFRDKITVLHLHDNNGPIENGTGDEHKMLGEGTIDLDLLAKNIASLSDDIVLCAEYKSGEDEINKDYFVRAKKSLDNLEKLVLSYKENERN